MRVLFIHGMGRTPFSGWWLCRHLQRAGFQTSSFGYSTTIENFAGIKARLITRVSEIAATGEYALIGHSLGGVLLRAALNEMPVTITRPIQVFLLGSPILPSRLALRLKDNMVFRAIAGDCGQLLGSVSRMAEIGETNVPTTGIAGIRGLTLTKRAFGEAPNDGVVSVSEVSAPWIAQQHEASAIHTMLPANREIAELIVRQLNAIDRPVQPPAKPHSF